MPKKQTKYNKAVNLSYKKQTKRITSVFVVFLLLTTTVFSVIGSAKIGDRINNLKEKIDAVKEGTNTLIENLKNVKSQDISNEKTIIRPTTKGILLSFRTLSAIRATSDTSTLNFYTNYNGIQKTSQLKFFSATEIDVDNDGDKDISTKLFLYPGIEVPFALSINFGLTIKRLNGFANENAFFEAYAEIIFPGTINSDIKDDKVYFGYQSPNGELVPPSCDVTYKYLPHIFLKKPEHKVVLNTGLSSGKDDLNMVYSYIEMNAGAVVEKNTWKTRFSPAVRKTTVSVGRVSGNVGLTFKLDSGNEKTLLDIHHTKESGGNTTDVGLLIDKVSGFEFSIKLTPLTLRSSKIEYKRISGSDVDVTLYKPNSDDTTSCAYVKKLPKTITVEWQPRLLSGYIDLNANGEHVESAGLRNNLDPAKATSMVYLTNLPSETRIEWSGSVFTQKTITLICDAAGTSAHVYSTDFMGKGVLLDAQLHSNLNIDVTMHWDLSNHVFKIDRTSYDLELSMYVKGENNSVFELYSEIKNTMTSPFEVHFGEFLDGEIDFLLSGRNLEINNLDASLYIPEKGSFSVKWIQLKITNQGSIHIMLSSSETTETTKLCWDIIISNGIIIDDLVIGFKDKIKTFNDIVETGYARHQGCTEWDSEFTAKWYIADDFSEGYFMVTGDVSLSFDSKKERPVGTVIGYAHGTISFETSKDVFNVSWKTVNGKIQLDINGEGVLSLSGFDIWVKDKFSLRVPLLTGNFKGSIYDKSGEIQLLVEDGEGSFNIQNLNVDVDDIFNVTFKGIISADVQAGIDGILEIKWDETGITHIGADGTVSLNGNLDISNMYFKYYNSVKTTEMSANKLIFNGVLDVDFILEEEHFEINTFDVVVDLNYLSYTTDTVDTDPTIVTANKIHVSSDGSIIIDGNTITLDADAELDLVNCHAVIPDKADLIVTFYADLSATGQFNIIADKVNKKFDITVSSGSGYAVIDYLDLNMDSGTTIVKCKEFRAKASGYGSITLQGKTILTLDVDATLTSLYLDTLEFKLPLKKLVVSGNFNLAAAGQLIIKADSTSDPKYVQAELVSGSATISNCNIILNEGDLEASWISLIIVGSFVLNIEQDTTDNLLDIGGSGKGSVTLTTASVTNEKEIVDVQLGYFKLDLDDVEASIIDLIIDMENKVFEIGSASVTGSVTEISIQNLIVNTNEIQHPETGWTLLEITDLNMEFTGNGDVSIGVSEPDTQGFQEISINGQLTGSSSIYIEYMVLYIPIPMWLGLREFNIEGPTTFHLNAQGKVNLGEEDLAEMLDNFHLEAGCDSTWSIGNLSIGGFLKILDFEGQGDVSLGAQINQMGASIEDIKGDLILDLDGVFNWVAFELVLLSDDYWAGPNIGLGSYNGNMVIYIDLSIVLFAFGIQGAPLPVHSHIYVTTNEYTEFDLLGLSQRYGISWIAYAGPISLQAGDFEISWDIDAIGGTPDYNGYLFIDTNNNWAAFPITVFNLIKVSNSVKTEDFNISWDWDKILDLFFNTKINGDIDFDPDFEILLFIENQYRALTLDSGNQPPVARFTWTPTTPKTDETVTFDASSSSDPDVGGIVSEIRWNFGYPDQWTDWHSFSLPAWKKPTYDYDTVGTYTVKCQVKDLLGLESTITSHTITITANTQYLQGYVYEDKNNDGNYDSGEGIYGATVTVKNHPSETDTTDSNGFYKITIGGYGYRTVTASKTGYHDTTIENIYIGPGETVTRNIELIPETQIVNPTVYTIPDAENIQTSSATIKGRIDNDGNDPDGCMVWFKYRKAGTATWYTKTVSGTYYTGGTFSATLTGLLPYQQYNFMAYAENQAGQGAGDIESFTTLSLTPQWVSPDFPHDPMNSGWYDGAASQEEDACDQDENTAATYRVNEGGLTDPLILDLSDDIQCNGFKILAKNNDHLKYMRIELWNRVQGSLKYVEEYIGVGSWTSGQNGNYEEFMISDGSYYPVDQVRIYFELESGYTYGGLDPHWAAVYEFFFSEFQ